MSLANTKDVILPFILGILAVLFAIAINKGYEKLGFTWLFIGLLIVGFLTITNCTLLGVLVRSSIMNELKDEMRILRQFVRTKEFSWLSPLEELDAIERKTKGSEVWVVSPDLKNDTGKAAVVPIVKKNASRGILYAYITPDTEIVRGRVTELREVFRNNPDKLKLRLIPEGDFSLLSNTHVVVYNPRSEKGKSAEVFWELPIDGRGWWVKMSADDAAVFLGKITRIVDSLESYKRCETSILLVRDE